MDILLRVVVVLEDVPAFVDAVLCRIVQRPEAEVVEDGLHAARVDLVDVGLQGREAGRTAGDVEVGGQRVFARAAQRPVVLVVPVLELHAVDVVAVQVVDHTLDAALGHLAERREEPVAREAGPVARHVDADRRQDGFTLAALLVDFDEISGEVLVGCGPGPGGSRGGLFAEVLAQVAVADVDGTGRHLAGREGDGLAGGVCRLVGRKGNFGVLAGIGVHESCVSQLLVAGHQQESRENCA